MSELNPDSGTLRFGELGDLGDCWNEIILPQARVTRRGATSGVSFGGLNHDEPRAAQGKFCIMRKVPVRHETMLSGIREHWGQPYPVLNCDVSDC